ncbi:MAG: type II toxin-antitoxin system RelE/ParE family toxin [Acidobacteria bacterium]|nr:type II toxin-antitoxin system RelE/ParE family toxin [Acidobacteriota bacterium]
MRKLIFYETQRGDCPVEEFLDSLTGKQARKVTWVLEIVETFPIVPIQYFKKLIGTNDIWEVRVDFGSDTLRLLGFMDKGNLVILTNGFAKKSQKAPPAEIDIAEQRKKEYLSRGVNK